MLLVFYEKLLMKNQTSMVEKRLIWETSQRSSMTI